MKYLYNFSTGDTREYDVTIKTNTYHGSFGSQSDVFIDLFGENGNTGTGINWLFQNAPP